MRSRLMIIDDEKSICVSLSLALQNDYDVAWETDPALALERLKIETYDLILLDLVIGETDGLTILDSIRRYDPRIIVIMMTAYGSIRSSVEAMRRGVFTYLTKPLDLDELNIHISKALAYRELNENVDYLNQRLSRELPQATLIGASPALLTIQKMIDSFRSVDTSVLISGESGTGKTVVAFALHDKEKRKRFVRVNCHNMDEGQLEAELLGYVSDDDAGNTRYQRGKFDDSDQGTLYLHGVDDLPLTFQTTLVRILEEKSFAPVGGRDRRHFDTRVIASTACDLREKIEEGSFRSDLYYRLNAVEIAIPPLRERREDIILFCDYFLNNNEMLMHRPVPILGFEQDALDMLKAHDYPGNVRELANAVQFAGIVCSGEWITVQDLPYQFTDHNDNSSSKEQFLRGKTLQELEQVAVHASYARHRGKRNKIAAELGISKRGLWNKLKEYDLD